MGSGRGKQRRAQSSVSEELADWLGELPNQLGAVIDTLPDGREKDALRGALSEVAERNVPEAQEELLSGKHDELLEGQKALKRAELAGAAAAWEEAQKELALIPKLRRIGVMTAEPGDKILGIGSEAGEENALVLNEGQKQIMESVLADSLSSLDPARPEMATLQGLQEKIADLTEADKVLTMSEDETSVFNQLFRVLDCPDGVGPI